MEDVVTDTDRRILLVGGRGWVGKAVQKAAEARGYSTLATGSRDSIATNRDLASIVKDFSPTSLVFLAGVTPDRGPQLGEGGYHQALARTHAELQAVLSRYEFDHLTYLSSGIAGLHPLQVDQPFREMYRRAKVAEEDLIAALPATAAALTLRVYSLSGPYARDPLRYALFDFINQARLGRITVTANQLVRRSYVSVLDVAQVILKSAEMGISGVRSTGGEPVELADLAERVALVINPAASVVTDDSRSGMDDYVGDDVEWRSWCAEVGVSGAELPQQIRQSEMWLDQAGLAGQW